jgi:hypothetical protein
MFPSQDSNASDTSLSLFFKEMEQVKTDDPWLLFSGSFENVIFEVHAPN